MKLAFASGFASGIAAAGIVGTALRKPSGQKPVTDSRAWWRAGETLLKKGGADVIFLGSGSSTGVPGPKCLLPLSPATEKPEPDAIKGLKQKLNSDGRTLDCHVCAAAREAMSSNTIHIGSQYRNNPSIVIRFEDAQGVRRHVLIDCGKTFRDSVLRWFPYYGIPGLDAVILTHDHADAILGLDDIRSVQRSSGDTAGKPMPVFLTQETMNRMKGAFPYLLPKETPDSPNAVQRFVASLDWQVVKPYVQFEAAGLPITPLPVIHGEDYDHMLAFDFGSAPNRFIYMSDVSRIPEKTLEALQTSPIEIMVLDSLFLSNTHSTHINFPQALEILAQLRPKRALLVGMSHDFDNEDIEARIKQARASDPRLADIDIQLASDGLRVPITLSKL